jgi:hypothetical protein
MDSNRRGKLGSMKSLTGSLRLVIHLIGCLCVETALRACLRLVLVNSSIVVSAGMVDVLGTFIASVPKAKRY